ncbi:hypothetical protein AX14_006650, partial [Amanita brunnescens Koide BX004]
LPCLRSVNREISNWFQPCTSHAPAHDEYCPKISRRCAGSPRGGVHHLETSLEWNPGPRPTRAEYIDIHPLSRSCAFLLDGQSLQDDSDEMHWTCYMSRLFCFEPGVKPVTQLLPRNHP